MGMIWRAVIRILATCPKIRRIFALWMVADGALTNGRKGVWWFTHGALSAHEGIVSRVILKICCLFPTCLALYFHNLAKTLQHAVFLEGESLSSLRCKS